VAANDLRHPNEIGVDPTRNPLDRDFGWLGHLWLFLVRCSHETLRGNKEHVNWKVTILWNDLRTTNILALDSTTEVRMGTTMAKRKPAGETAGETAGEKGGRRTAPVQVEKDLARMAAVIASHRGITQADLCSPVLRPFLIAQYRLVQQEIGRELKEQE
jgi:hypothetical protein